MLNISSKAKKNGLTKSGEFVKPMDKNKSTSHGNIKWNDTPSETKNTIYWKEQKSRLTWQRLHDSQQDKDMKRRKKIKQSLNEN